MVILLAESMPTPVSHALAGTSVYLWSRRGRDPWFFLAAVFAACFADLDFMLNLLTGKNYHHYFTHSLAFATLFFGASFIALKALKRPDPGRDAAILFLAYLTHMGLDLFSKDTTAPFGMELWWPFSKEFAIAPVILFDDIERGTLAKLFSAHNWLAVGREVVIVGPIVAASWWWSRKRA